MKLPIGTRLKEMRTKKKLSIAELSKMSEVSTGLISQIERDLVVPSVVSLWRLAQALDTHISLFFEEAPQTDGIIIRRGEHRVIVTHNSNTFYKMLSPSTSSRLLDLTEVRLKGGCSYEKKDTVCHEGEECGYVLKGTLTLILNESEYILYEGDSISFSSTLPHKYINETEEDCISIWAMTPTFF